MTKIRISAFPEIAILKLGGGGGGQVQYLWIRPLCLRPSDSCLGYVAIANTRPDYSEFTTQGNTTEQKNTR